MKFEDYVNESSLSRIYSHIKKETIDSWSIQTSYLDVYSSKENKKRFKEFQNKVRSLGYGFIRIEGVGQETDEDGNIAQVKEKSLFIPKITLNHAKKLAKDYGQTAFIYSGPELGIKESSSDRIALVWTKSGNMEFIGSFHPMKLAQFYSRIRGRPFTFESILPMSYMERYGNYIKSKK